MGRRLSGERPSEGTKGIVLLLKMTLGQLKTEVITEMVEDTKLSIKLIQNRWVNI